MDKQGVSRTREELTLDWEIVWLRDILDNVLEWIDGDDVGLIDIWRAMDKYRNETREYMSGNAEFMKMQSDGICRRRKQGAFIEMTSLSRMVSSALSWHPREGRYKRDQTPNPSATEREPSTHEHPNAVLRLRYRLAGRRSPSA